MADYAGAVAAMQARFVAAWTATPIAFQNEKFTPPVNPDPNIAEGLPWVLFEVLGNESELRGAGTPGDHIWLYTGHIYVHVYVPINSGAELARQYAVAAGEVFRAAGFYNDGQGSIVRTTSPTVRGGGSSDDTGNWFRVSCVIPFEFYYRG